MVAYHDFEGITIHAEEGPAAGSIGNKPAVILRNHGLLSWGRTLEQTFASLWTLQRACEIQLATLSMGAAIPVPEAWPPNARATRCSSTPPRRRAATCSTRWCGRWTGSTTVIKIDSKP
jgi:ribulose-5-phosphate 4-epimerase/fuculose-1-phosphate aldolase